MNLPNVRTVLEDPTNKIRYVVIAYRALGRDELIGAVRTAVSMMKRKPKKNSTYEFITSIGARD